MVVVHETSNGSERCAFKILFHMFFFSNLCEAFPKDHATLCMGLMHYTVSAFKKQKLEGQSFVRCTATVVLLSLVMF